MTTIGQEELKLELAWHYFSAELDDRLNIDFCFPQSWNYFCFPQTRELGHDRIVVPIACRAVRYGLTKIDTRTIYSHSKSTAVNCHLPYVYVWLYTVLSHSCKQGEFVDFNYEIFIISTN